MKRLLILILSLTYLSANAQNFDYLPAPVGDHQIIAYTQFTLSYNNEHEQADWVAYELTKEEVQMDQDRCNCFKIDSRVNLASATDRDYSSSGFDRGHLSPSADNNLSEEANEESFLFSNISPQLARFNSGIWANLEEWVREQAIESDTIYVVTGSVFVNNLGKIGDNGVTIPSYFYKIVLKFEEDRPKTIAFLLPHIGATSDFKDYQVQVNSIESLTGIDFFPALNNSIENRVEAHMGKSSWNLN